jgi:hypothetical protein
MTAINTTNALAFILPSSRLKKGLTQPVGRLGSGTPVPNRKKATG